MTIRTSTDFIAVHCSATPPKVDVGATEIRKWHTAPPPAGNGWSDIGYHIVIRRNGVLELGRALDQVGSHVAGYNSISLGVCLIGGIADDGKSESNYTAEQWISLLVALRFCKGYAPKAKIQGHRDFPDVKKDCPSFNVREWLAENAADLL